MSEETAADTAAEQAAEPKTPSRGSKGTRAQLPASFEANRWARAFWRWLPVMATLAVLGIIYLNHPYYRSDTFIPWRSFYPMVLGFWAFLGLPYCYVTLKRYEQPGADKKSPNGTYRSFWTNDGALLLTVIYRVFWGKRKFKIFRHRRLKNTVLSAVVKGFFTPLMIGFVSGHLTSVANAIAKKKGVPTLPMLHSKNVTYDGLMLWGGQVKRGLLAIIPSGDDIGAFFHSASYTLPNVKWGVDLTYDMVFIVDCGFALVGYALESRWFGNKTKSVEPTGLGWAVAIFCYPPFNNILGTYLPFGGGAKHIESEAWLVGLKGITVGFFIIYAWATVSFGAKFSNLTNRGIITRGPYRWIRHPAYTCKCIAWWLEQLPTLSAQTALALIGLCGVYAMRAWTEERHLSMDPEYRAYQKKVKWVSIPGLF